MHTITPVIIEQELAVTTTPADGLQRLVNDIHHGLARLFNHQAAEHGLTRPQWRVMAGIYRQDGITQTELADAIGMTRAPLGKIIDLLEAEGLVERVADPNDRRINRLRITEKAAPLVRPAELLMENLEGRAFAGLTENERAIFLSQLHRIRAELNAELAEETVAWTESKVGRSKKKT